MQQENTTLGWLGRSAMAERIREHDWESTPLGPLDRWPAELKCAASTVLESCFPSALVWGPELVAICNDRFRQLVGERAQTLGQSFADAWRDSWSRVGPLVERAFSGESTLVEECPLVVDRAVQPEPAFFKCSCSPVRAADGKVLGCINTVVDITDAIRSREALRASEERLRSVLETDAVAVLFFNRDGLLVDANEGFIRMTGWSRSDIESGALHWRSMTPPEWIESSETQLQQLQRTGRLGPYEKEYVCKDRDRKWMLLAGRELADGTVVEFAIDTSERQRTEAALRRSEARFRALVTAGAIMLYRMSPDWRQLYQLDGQGFLSDTVGPIENWAEEYLLPEDRPMVFAAIEAAIRNESAFELKHRVRNAEGEIGWVISRAVPVLGSRGEVTEWFGVAHDVTEAQETAERLQQAQSRYKAELERQVSERTAELKESRDLLQATMDSSTNMIQVFEAVRDPAGTIVDFRWLLNNHTSEKIFGDVIGQSLLEKNPGVMQEGIFETFKQVVETGAAHQAERHYVHEQFDGWFHQSVVKLGDGVATTTTDITERKRAEQEVLRLKDEVALAQLTEMEQRFRQFAEASSDILWIRSADGLEWEYVSPVIRDICGFDVAELMEDHSLERWAGLIHPEDRDRAVANLMRVRDGARVTHEFRIQRADGEWRWIRNTDFPLFDASGRVQRIGGIGRDTTAEKEAADRMQLMVAELQHRTRNLIAVVRSVASQTMRVTGPTERFREEFGHRLEALARVQGLLSRANEEPITLGLLVRMELDALGAEQLEPRVRVAGPEVRIRHSVVQTLALAIHELATNARKYGALSTDRDGSELTVTWRTYVDGNGPRLELQWLEKGGQAPESSALARQGYGRELIERALPYTLGAKTSFQHLDSHLKCSVDIPLERASVEAGLS